jgi:hypothetical protein
MVMVAVCTTKPGSSSFANTGNMATIGKISTETRPVNYRVYYYIRAIIKKSRII